MPLVTKETSKIGLGKNGVGEGMAQEVREGFLLETRVAQVPRSRDDSL